MSSSTPAAVFCVPHLAFPWEAAARVVTAARRAMGERGRFTLAISGGSTPLRLFELLAMGEWLVRLPWGQTELFWVDERAVPPDHVDSNYGAVERTLLARAGIPAEQVHRWHGEAADLEGEADRYQQLLWQRLDHDGAAGGMPRFDLVLLGMGTDGHTASLFPGSAALHERERLCAANFAPSQQSWRLTLTFRALNAAREALFLVSGADKAPVVQRALESDAAIEQMPARGVRLVNGDLTWLLDDGAASLLTTPS